MKRQPSEWEKIFANEATNNLSPKYTNSSCSSIAKKIFKNNKESNQKWAEVVNRHSSKEDTQTAKRHMKQCPTSLITRGMSTQTTVKYHLTLVRMATIKNSTHRDFPGGPGIKNLPANAGDTDAIPGLGRSHVPQDNEAVHHSYGARAPERVLRSRRSHHKQPRTATEEIPFPLPLTRESPPTARKTQKYFFKSTNSAGEGVEERQQSCTN